MTLTAVGSGGTPPYTYLWDNVTPGQTYDVGAGTYTVMLSDSSGCPPTFETITVNEFANPISVFAGNDDTVCVQNPLVTLNAVVQEATGGIWSGGNGVFSPNNTTLTNCNYTPTATELTNGFVDLIITTTGNAGCPSDNDTVRIYFIDFQGNIVVTPTNISCFGLTDGELQANVVGGTAPFDYTWNTAPIQINATATNLPIGTYNVTVVDGIGCTNQASGTITQPSPLVANISATRTTCNGGADGTVSVSAVGGTPGYTYLWAPGGETTSSITGAAGSYSVTVTDTNGCSIVVSDTINQPSPITITLNPSNVNCNSGNNGSISAIVGGGTPSYNYNWSPYGGTFPTATGLSADTYTLTVTDAKGCVANDSVLITEPVQALSASINVTNVSCNGGNNGSLSVVPSGGTPGYTYLWMPGGQTTPAINGLTAGNYFVTVTDTLGCTITEFVSIIEPTPLTVSISQSNVLCNGGNDGGALATVSGGTPSYSYLWMPGNITTASATNLSEGIYQLTVTDTNGCQVIDSVIITQPSSPITTTFSSSSVSCNGGADGSLSVIPSGGKPGYTYLWSLGGQTSSFISNQTAGVYSVTITDTNGCTFTSSDTIFEPTPLILTLTPNNVSCNGGSNGSISTTVSGGVSPYSYLWTPNGEVSSSISGLLEGMYSVVVQDSNKCKIRDSLYISQPSTPVNVIINITNTNCNGGSDGAIEITPMGGTPGYTYLWLPGGQTTSLISGQTAGTYTITVTDSNGCVFIDTAIVDEPTLPLISFSQVVHVSCNGDSDGAVSTSVVGGTPTYDYLWMPGAISNSTASGLTAGTYTLQITDNNGCQVQDSVNITEPLTLSLSTNMTEPTCNGGSDGSASVVVFGGTAPYQYLWTQGGQTTSVINNQEAGTYTVTVTDANGCVATTNVVITEPAPIVLNVGIMNSNCGLANGTAYVEIVSGGTAPYNYLWSPVGGSNDTATSLFAGVYDVNVTDVNGCEVSGTASVTDISAAIVIVDSTVNVSCYGGNDGMIFTSLTGGTGPFTYLWTPSGDTNAIASGLSAGLHNVTVTDSLGCVSSITAQLISEPDSMISSITVSNVSCYGGNDGTANVSTIGGTFGYTYLWLPDGFTGASVTGLSAGIDTLITTDANGCSITTLFQITEPSAPLSVNLSSTPVSCYGGSNGSVSVTASGGTPLYNFTWLPGNISGSLLLGLPTGTYTVTAEDNKGCLVQDSITVNEPLDLNLSSSTINSTCGAANGQATIHALGGTPNYTYQWFPVGGTDSTAVGLLQGNYIVSVKDFNGCTKYINLTLNNTAGPTVSVASTTNVSCFGGSNGTATANVVGGTAPFSYQWSPLGGTGATATGLTVGTYLVSVTDSNGCQAFANTPLITQPTQLVSIVTPSSVSCFGGNDGGASIVSFGGTPTYSYQWLPSGSVGPSITNLSAGLDSVVTTDNNGCTITNYFNITQPNILTASVASTTNVSCFGGNNGSASINVSGGTPNYTFSWSPYGGNGSSAIGLVAGNYAVTVTDSKGCSEVVNVSITQPALSLMASYTTSPASCFGESNGVATINAIGGTSPYSYAWLPISASGQTQNNLLAGTYHVVVSDTLGCSTSISVIVNQPTQLQGDLTVVQPSCGFNNGIISTNITGGTAPYNYLWNPDGQISPIISALNPGNYDVTVTDNNGCTTNFATTLTNIAGPQVDATSVSSVGCFGGNNGTAFANITSGTSPYQISWSPFGGNSPLANSLIAGNYTVYVIDSLGCIASDTVTITQPNPLNISSGIVENVSCNGGNDGTISINVIGGTTPYSYNWNPVTTPADSISNLQAGIYQVTVNDINNCAVTNSFVVTEPTSLNSNILGVIHPNCYTSSNGSAFVDVSGGTMPYNYLWSNGNTGNVVNGLSGGQYTVDITDNKGCLISDTVIINQPLPVQTIAGLNDTVCLGQTATLSAVGSQGVGTYTYAWQPLGVVNNGVLNVMPTTTTQYTVMAFDQNGCPGNLDTVYAYVITLNPSNVQAEVTVPSICLGQISEVSVQENGILDTLTYTWNQGLGTGSGPFSVSPTIATTYLVSATNTCGVSVQDSVTINITPPPTLLFVSDTDSSCVPATIIFNDNSIVANPADQLHYWLWDFGDGTTSQVQNPQHEYETPGTYQVTLTVTTGNGCTSNNITNPYRVYVFPNPTADFNLNSHEFSLPIETMTTNNTSVGAVSYIWDFGDGSTSTEFNPSHLYSSIGIYTVQLTAINQYGCTDIAFDEIRTTADLVIPNAFTPSTSGSSGGYYDVNSLDNDIFFPYASGIIEYQFEIYNRWGELIFVTDDFKQGWDGYYKGELVQKGVYVWKIYAKFNNNKIVRKTGDVTLLR